MEFGTNLMAEKIVLTKEDTARVRKLKHFEISENYKKTNVEKSFGNETLWLNVIRKFGYHKKCWGYFFTSNYFTPESVTRTCFALFIFL